MRIQKKINSGFDSSSTASEVLSGVKLFGKKALITGGHSGLGFESAKALSAAGVNVVVASRNVSEAKKSLSTLAGVTVKELDLSDLNSVKSFSSNIVNSGIKFDFIICNAGVMACPEKRVGPGWESQFAVNHIGHYVLINSIWSSIQEGGRIVCVSSAGHHNSPIRWDDIQFIKNYDKWLAYGQSKTANALFALQLDEFGKNYNIRAFSLHPGKIFTPLQRYLEKQEMVSEGWLDEAGNPADPTFKTPAQGAATQIWAATSPLLDGVGGLYCEDCDIALLASEYDEPFRGVCLYATDLQEANRLWRFTANLTGVDYFI